MNFKVLYLTGLFTAGLSISASTAVAGGKIETSCSDDVKIACKTKDPEILNFRKEQIKKLYNGLIYPGPIEIMKDPAKANDIFQEGFVKGRVTPVGSFTDFNGVVEYFYALAANPQNHVFDIKFTSVLADEDQASVTVDLAFCENTNTDCEGMTSYQKKKDTLTEIGYFVFNKQNKITFFDVVIPNLSEAKDAKNPIEKAGRIAGICAFLTVGHIDPITGEQKKGGTCTEYFDSRDDFGSNAKFLVIPGAAFVNCVAFMSSIPFGSYARANSNSFTCRQTHALLTPLRPEYHCAHTAFDGGGKCIDFPYETYYEPIEAAPGHGH